MNKIIGLLCTAALCLLCSCSNTTSFKVEGTLDDGATMNLRIIYPGNDVLNNVVTAAREGKFTFQGRAPKEGALVQVFTHEYSPLGFFFAKNGDNIKVTVKKDILTATGNEVNERLGVWLTKNAAFVKSTDTAKINAAVAAYVKANSSDPVSAMLLAVLYDASTDPLAARRLIESLAPEARPTGMLDGMVMEMERVTDKTAVGKIKEISYLTMADTMATFRPKAHKKTLLAFDNGERMRRDSVLSGLRLAHKAGIHVIDFSMDADTFAWRSSARRDSTQWTHAWLPGGLGARGIDRLGIARLPFYIAVDASGRQLYRGPSLTAARSALK